MLMLWQLLRNLTIKIQISMFYNLKKEKIWINLPLKIIVSWKKEMKLELISIETGQLILFQAKMLVVSFIRELGRSQRKKLRLLEIC